MTAGQTIWEGWGSVVLVVSVTVLGLLLLGVIIWQIFKTAQTKMTIEATASQEAAYRVLAEQATAAQQQANGTLTVLSETVAELNARVASIERLLKEVG